ncbi:MAG: DUF2007 domain-containing protein [Bacteroidales bacterium]
MEKNLVEVFSADQKYIINIIRELLDEKEIQSLVLDQKGSALLLGEIKVYVNKEDEKKAKQIIEAHDI